MDKLPLFYTTLSGLSPAETFGRGADAPQSQVRKGCSPRPRPQAPPEERKRGARLGRRSGSPRFPRSLAGTYLLPLSMRLPCLCPPGKHRAPGSLFPCPDRLADIGRQACIIFHNNNWLKRSKRSKRAARIPDRPAGRNHAAHAATCLPAPRGRAGRHGGRRDHIPWDRRRYEFRWDNCRAGGGTVC